MSSTTSATAEHRTDHPPQPDAPLARPAARARRVGLFDRAALRLGILLITWSRRTHRTREELQLRHRQQRALEQRQLAAQRELLLSTTLR